MIFVPLQSVLLSLTFVTNLLTKLRFVLVTNQRFAKHTFALHTFALHTFAVQIFDLQSKSKQIKDLLESIALLFSRKYVQVQIFLQSEAL